ncbi:MAG: HAMP domain-containing histidine kinase [Spirochaetota bacterium]|nr:MAG: HAMP domain-containing histidine kinase [Spirochaetota bacterium]
MMKFFQRFSVKLSLLFLALLLTMGIVQVIISIRITERRQIETDQLVNRYLAQDMVHEIEPYVQDDIDLNEIGSVIHYMMVMNPKIEIYLLDAKGKILAFFAEPGIEIQQDYVDIDPIQTFLKESSPIPLYGTDPRNPMQDKHFSVAPISIGEEDEGYLYIVLRSSLYDRAESMLRENYLFSTFNMSIILSLLFVGIIGLILFMFLTKRLQEVSKAVQDFKQGSFDRRIETDAVDEIGSLAKAFNQMAYTINAHVEQLKKTDELRRELVANVSHDLKSPLATIQGYIETLLIKGDRITDAERKRFLEIVLQSTKSLDMMVGELLELSKLETKQVEPVLEVFSMTDLAQDVFMKFKPGAEKRNIQLSAEIPENLCFVKADIALIERVMTNLLDNAIKNTPEHGTVQIELYCFNDKTRFSVLDSGKGIASEDIPHLFERFYIGRSGERKSERGTGLGLAISQKIMELHESSINVENRLDQGSSFFFELPSVMIQSKWERGMNS